MKILAINGSARKQSNTGDMIDVVVKELPEEYEIEIINLDAEKLKPVFDTARQLDPIPQKMLNPGSQMCPEFGLAA